MSPNQPSNSLLTLLDFYANWCGPCRQMEPILQEIAQEFASRVALQKINADQDQAMVQKYQVRSLPTYFFIKDGQAIGQLVGFQTKHQLAKKIGELLALD